MVDASATKENYFKICKETNKEPDGEMLAVLNHVMEEQIL